MYHTLLEIIYAPWLLCHTFSHCNSVSAKKKSTSLSLNHKNVCSSNLPKCMHLIWCPHLKKGFVLLEQIQRRGAEFNLGDFSSDYKYFLTSLQLLPPYMLALELNDILFLVKSLKNPSTFQYLSLHFYVYYNHHFI